MKNKPALSDIIVELHVPDFKKVLDFYGKLGFKQVWQRLPKAGARSGYLVMQRGNSILSFYCGNEEVYNHSDFHQFPRDTHRGYGVEIAIYISDMSIDAYYQQVIKNLGKECIVTDLQTKPWGSKDFRIIDPFGYYFRINQDGNILKNIQSYEIKNEKATLPLRINFFDRNAPQTMIVIGGSADTKEKFTNLIERFPEDKYNFVTFSFRGYEEQAYLSIKQQQDDLLEVLQWVISKGYQDLILIVTSLGAYAAIYALLNQTVNKYIHRVILVDPADYYLEPDKICDQAYSWNGSQPYQPTTTTISTLLAQIPAHIKIDVLNLLLRNFTKEGYVAPELRSQNNPGCVPRLNPEMVKAFYTNTPEKNRENLSKTLPSPMPLNVMEI